MNDKLNNSKASTYNILINRKCLKIFIFFYMSYTNIKSKDKLWKIFVYKTLSKIELKIWKNQKYFLIFF